VRAFRFFGLMVISSQFWFRVNFEVSLETSGE
jgi:hypothetical protein